MSASKSDFACMRNEKRLASRLAQLSITCPLRMRIIILLPTLLGPSSTPYFSGLGRTSRWQTRSVRLQTVGCKKGLSAGWEYLEHIEGFTWSLVQVDVVKIVPWDFWESTAGRFSSTTATGDIRRFTSNDDISLLQQAVKSRLVSRWLPKPTFSS